MSFYGDGQSQNGNFEESGEGHYDGSDIKAETVDNEYYSFLHVSRTASDEEIVSAYKKFSRLYHPDKHRDEDDKKKAEVMFAKLKNAYEVLSDPHKRAIYDCLGKKGLEEQGWQLVKRTKTPQEIREEYEQLAKERAERRLQMRTNPTTKMQVTVNATDLFERYLYNEELDDVLDTSLPSLEVTEVSLGQTIEMPISNTQKVILAGNVGTQNGTGNGSMNFTFRRIPSMRCWQDLDVGFGNGPSLGTKLNYIFTNAAFANTSGSLQFTPRGLQPTYSFSVGNRLGKQTMGYLSFTSNFLAKNIDSGISITHNASAMSTSIVHDTPNYHLFGSFQLGLPSTFLSFSATRKFNEGETKVKGALKIGTFGALVEYGVERKITKHSAISAFMVVGLPPGVTLRVRVVRSSQTYTFPIHLSDEIMLQPIFYGTITPLIIWFTLKKLVFDPMEDKKQEEERKRESEANLQKLIEERKDALSSISLMRARYTRIVLNEASQNGLIILVALYGRILSETHELLVNLESGPVSIDCNSSTEFEDLNLTFPFLDLKSQNDVIDVTIPVQCLVEDGGKLILYEGGSKTDLAGFYDPCAPTTIEMIKDQKLSSPSKHLLIRYLFQNQLHQVIVDDDGGVQVPKTTHRIERV